MMCIIYKNSRMKLYKMLKLIFVEKKVEIFRNENFLKKILDTEFFRGYNEGACIRTAGFFVCKKG